MDFWRTLLANTAVSIFGRALGLVISFLYTLLLARALSPPVFGDFTFLFAAAAVVSAFSDLGLWATFSRSLASGHHDELMLARSAFWLRCLILGLLLAMAAAALPILPHPFGLGFILALLSFAILRIFEFLVGYFQTQGDMSWVAGGELAGRATQLLALSFVLSFAPASFVALVATQPLGSLVQLAVTGLGARRMYTLIWPPQLRMLVTAFRQTMLLGGAALLQTFYFRAPLLALKFASSPYELGIFSLPFRILEIAVFVPGTLSGLLLPQFSRHHSAGPSGGALHGFPRRTLLGLGGLGLVSGAALFSAFPSLIYILGGEMWQEATSIAQILAVSFLFIFLGSLLGIFLIGVRQDAANFRVSLAAALVACVANIILVPRGGALGAAWALVLTELVAALLLFYYVKGQPGPKTRAFRPLDLQIQDSARLEKEEAS